MTEITLNRKFEPLFREKFRYAVITGGRGSGKSFATSLWLAMNFMDAKFNFIYLREYLANAAVSIIPQFLNQVSTIGAKFYSKNAEVINQNGKKMYFRGFHSASSTADSNLKSLTNLAVALIDEATEVKEDEFVKLDLSLRDKRIFTKDYSCS